MWHLDDDFRRDVRAGIKWRRDSAMFEIEQWKSMVACQHLRSVRAPASEYNEISQR